MAKLDRSKYRASSSEELQKESEKMKELTSTGRGAFIKIEPGTNKLRMFPAPLKAKSSLFCFPKVTSFLPFMVDEVNDKGEKTGKQVIKRKAIFNAKVHGDLSFDLVEEYIEACRNYFSSMEKDKKKVFEKMKVITDFKKGIKPSSAWIAYAYKLVGEKKEYGRVQITEGVHKQMDALSLREGDSNKPIIVDLFSHPDDGKMIQWFSDPNNEDLKSRNKITILFEKNTPLTDEELEMLENWDSLESLYKNSYKKSDFKKQLEGLQLFDEQNKIGVFDSPAFQSKIDICREEFEEIYGSLDEDDENEDGSAADDDYSSQQNKTTTTRATSTKKTEESTIPILLEEMDKKTLISLVEKLELEVDIKVTTPPSKIRQIIKDEIIKVYELEGTNDEINDSIVNIITDSLDSEDNDGDSNGIDDVEYESSDNDGDETMSDESMQEEVQEEVKEEEEKPQNKRSSLMNKYQRKK